MDGVMIFLIATGAFVLGIAVAVLVLRSAQIKGEASTPGETPPDADGQELDKERELLEKSTRSMREILVGLALAVKNLEGAASNSNSKLTTVRNTLNTMSLPADIGKCQELILAEVDKVIRTNTELRGELGKAQEQLARQKQLIDSLQIAATTDRLTKVGNRASFEDFFRAAYERFKLGGAPFSLIMLDVDHFKRINDEHGHIIGDRVLEALADKLRVCLRATDFIARYGGEEFAVILEKSSLSESIHVAENLRDSVETTVFRVEGKHLRLTVSMGCASAERGDNTKDIIARADEELYKAKRYGRNVVFPRGV